MLIQDAIAFIDGLAEELDTEIGKLWEQGQGELSSELSHRYRKFEAIKEMLENYNALVSKHKQDSCKEAYWLRKDILWNDEVIEEYRCSNCGYTDEIVYKYRVCPNCNAKIMNR